MAVQAPNTPAAARAPRAWPRIFLAGFALWIATVLVTFLTANTALLPTIVLLGSFLVPVTFVAWAHEHDTGEHVTVELLFSAFIIGGVLGVLGASLLETYLLASPSPLQYIGVGVIEETVKLLALLFVARDMARRTPRDGLVLGAAVGFGFAAFESAGYALNALVTSQGFDLLSLVETEVLRGLLTPVGHGLWTAIVGGVLFAASPGRRWHFTGGVLAALVGVALLHALWDSVHGLAVLVTLVFTGSPWQEYLLHAGRIPDPAPGQAALILTLDVLGLLAVSAVGLAWLWTLVSRARPTGPEGAGGAPPDGPQGTDGTQDPAGPLPPRPDGGTSGTF
ncbi:PrsW family intramembrane metalloprotease [Nocardiopsis sediminis]|uniref:PrsW family intramembrane metalloprotease n=1 Tax=Nocardiopsis sediminis TaxID=1778267 RepID=A0ABV8FT99_9ACTN